MAEYWGFQTIARRLGVSSSTLCRWRRDLLFPLIRRHKVLPSRSGLRHRLRPAAWTSDDLITRWLERRSLAQWTADRKHVPSPLQAFLAMGTLAPEDRNAGELRERGMDEQPTRGRNGLLSVADYAPARGPASPGLRRRGRTPVEPAVKL